MPPLNCQFTFDSLEYGNLPFFMDSGGRMEVGQKIGEGGQAAIYEAALDGKVIECVLKVFNSELGDLQRHWVTEIGRKREEWIEWYQFTIFCCSVKRGTLLKDGRFAFVLKRYWGDLRKAIDLQIVKDKTHQSPPFPLSMAIAIMFLIAREMSTLHEKGIVHRDLKAANVLMTNEIVNHITREEEIDLCSFDCYIADFESCEGVMGTGFWRAPEVLHAVKNKAENKLSDPKIWTTKVDVYSYAMTCYEVLTGCIPFQNRAANDYEGVLGGERPPLPDYVDPEIQELLRRCWHSEPLMRPTILEILYELDRFILKRSQLYKGLAEDERDAEAKRWLQQFGFLFDLERMMGVMPRNIGGLLPSPKR